MPYRPETYFMPSGSAAAPGLAFEDAPGVGIYRKASGELAFAAGGVEAAPAGGLRLATITFTQTSGNGVYTGAVSLPAGSRIIDIGCDAQVLWDASTSASLIVGDAVDPDGFFTATDLKATDLLAGEINDLEHQGGKGGAYIASEQRQLYQATARSVIAEVTQVGTGTAGRTRVYVVFGTATETAAAKV
jgi:hypothetical protein